MMAYRFRSISGARTALSCLKFATMRFWPKNRAQVFPAHVEGHCEAEQAFHGLSHHHGDVIAVLEDCQVVLCRGMGWRAATELVHHGINPLVIVGELSPRVAVEHYLAGTLQPASGFCRRQKEPAAAADHVEPASQRL